MKSPALIVEPGLPGAGRGVAADLTILVSATRAKVDVALSTEVLSVAATLPAVSVPVTLAVLVNEPESTSAWVSV